VSSRRKCRARSAWWSENGVEERLGDDARQTKRAPGPRRRRPTCRADSRAPDSRGSRTAVPGEASGRNRPFPCLAPPDVRCRRLTGSEVLPFVGGASSADRLGRADLFRLRDRGRSFVPIDHVLGSKGCCLGGRSPLTRASQEKDPANEREERNFHECSTKKTRVAGIDGTHARFERNAFTLCARCTGTDHFVGDPGDNERVIVWSVAFHAPWTQDGRFNTRSMESRR